VAPVDPVPAEAGVADVVDGVSEVVAGTCASGRELAGFVVALGEADEHAQSATAAASITVPAVISRAAGTRRT
jgi:hypothetical protein